MKRAITILLTLVSLVSAEEISFRKVQMTVPSGKKEVSKPVVLAFTDANELVVRDKTGELVKVPFAEITRIDYDFAKHHRIGTGAALMVVSLGVGAIVMATSSTKHWLEVQYHHDSEDHSLLLQLDKKDYRAVISAAEAKTGKTVIRSTESKDKEKKSK